MTGIGELSYLRKLGSLHAFLFCCTLDPTLLAQGVRQIPGNLVGSEQTQRPFLLMPGADPLAELGPDGLLPEERVNILVYDKCNRSVVHISTTSVAMDSFLQVRKRQGGGSGSILNQDGLILTNHHVIDGAREINVGLYNGRSYPAEVVGQDPATDIAILKINASPKELVPVEWGDSAKLRVGQRIYAIGNPFGLERSMSVGMISCLNRQIPSRTRRTMFSLIQIDASINQGNSGGPLFDTRGRLIGMNTAIMSSDGDSAGVGFAIPVSTIGRIAPQLIEHGKAVHPIIGINRVYENAKGVLVVDLVPGGPAEKAGLRGFQIVTKNYTQGQFQYAMSVLETSTADLIVGVDGKTIKTADELLEYVDSKLPGQTVQLNVIREGQSILVQLVLDRSEP
ncbi:MAG: trypsin-like peptidase domain-containing protein [Planctomycetota bacterium]|nr:trypsin-like peptidase domain-containing protein [Planctomycetota bacterium]